MSRLGKKKEEKLWEFLVVFFSGHNNPKKKNGALFCTRVTSSFTTLTNDHERNIKTKSSQTIQRNLRSFNLQKCSFTRVSAEQIVTARYLKLQVGHMLGTANCTRDNQGNSQNIFVSVCFIVLSLLHLIPFSFLFLNPITMPNKYCSSLRFISCPRMRLHILKTYSGLCM